MKSRTVVKPNFGPWSTEIGTGSQAHVGLLLKQRVHQLGTAGQSPEGVNRRTFLALAGGGIAISMLPVVTGQSIQAANDETESQNAPDGASGKIKLPGRIFIEARVGARDPIISLEPNTGEWTVIVPVDGEGPLISPDGKLMLYNRDLTIFVCSVDNPKKEKPFLLSAVQNAWTPDGKELIVTYTKKIWADRKEQRSATFRVAFDRARPPRKTPIAVPDTDYVCDWSSDGEWIVTQGAQGERKGQVFVMRLDGSDERKLTKRAGWKPRFSPNGKRVVFLDGGGLRSIHTIGIDGAQERTVLAADENFGVNGAVFSPDGKWLAVSAHNWAGEPGSIAASNEISDFRLLIVDLEGKIHKILRPQLQGNAAARVAGSFDWVE